MSIARHHNEWLSLMEISGPFLSMPVLLRVFPQGLDPRNTSKAKELSIAYEEWVQSPNAPGHHRAWVEFVLTHILEFPKEIIAEGQSLPLGTEVFMEIYGETLRPDIAIIGPADTPTAGKPQLLIQVYPHSQNLGSPIPGRLWKDSPATRMVELLRGAAVLLGLVTNGEEWMLVHALPGETSGFATWRSDIWQEEHITLRAFHSLLHCRRFFGVAGSDNLASMLKESAQDQQEVTEQLGYQVRRAVEVLVQAFDIIDQESSRKYLAGLDEKTIYDAALTIMMRLVFLFCAEERRLLRLGEPLYDDNYAVSTLRERLREMADQQGEEILERRSDAWARLLATFRAVHGGVEHESMRLLAYGGTLFDPDRYPFLEGRPPGSNWREAIAEPPAVNNRVVLHLLDSLQTLRVKIPGGGPAEARRISFRALDIEQIGHVYESLLDHTAVLAQTLFLGLKGTRDAESEVSLDLLEKNQGEGADKFLEFLVEQTGRSEQALRRDLGFEIVSAKRKKKNLQGFISSDGFSDHALLVSCRNNETFSDRIKPFKGLIRSDDFGRPVIIHPGCIFVTKGSERRSTGTHYTPRSLTEPIVQHTLEPLVYIGPAEGKPKDKWKLKSPREILELKVCDMAMGSGAFLVQACRYLAERLAEAWDELEKANPGKILATPEGSLSAGHPSERLIPIDPAERLAIARRYVADRCLYGVDINPMAVEMAKLSLWLITLQRDRPFTFLNHSLKCGDSLLGISSLKQIENFSLRSGAKQITFATASLLEYIEEASAKRRELEILPSNDYGQIEAKNHLYVQTENDIAKLRVLADCLIAFELGSVGGNDYEEKRTVAAERAMASMQKPLSEFLAYAREQLQGRRTFHWPVEFPEVFIAGGFSAFIGNPPFQGGLHLRSLLGRDYHRYLRSFHKNTHGNADYCAYMFLRAFLLLRSLGAFGLLAVNTIAEGDTRRTGLEFILQNGGTIYYAVSRLRWPGTAQVQVSLVHVGKGLKPNPILDGQRAVFIDASLSEAQAGQEGPHRLLSNSMLSFVGSYISGDGFILTANEKKDIISRSPHEASIIFPFVGGAELNRRISVEPSRYIINFYPLDKGEASKYELCFERVERLVKPHRALVKRERRSKVWWLFADQQAGLYFGIQQKKLSRVLAVTMTAMNFKFDWIVSDYVYDQTIVVILLGHDEHFALIHSSIHLEWAYKQGASFGSVAAPRYNPSRCFETFPFPNKLVSLSTTGRDYYNFRCELMRSRLEGLTKIYSAFHNPDDKSMDIEQLRTLQVEIDKSVAAAYGWSDLDLGHGFHETRQGVRYTLSESARRAVLDRLLALNHQRYEEEVKAGLQEKKAISYKRSSAKAGKGDITSQTRLLPDK